MPLGLTISNTQREHRFMHIRLNGAIDTRTQPFSYTDFTGILPDILAGWKSLSAFHKAEKKDIIVHLLTNRPLSKNDNIKHNGKKIGSCSDFYSEVWLKLRSNTPISNVWQPIADNLISITSLNQAEFKAFVAHFEFDFNFKPHVFGINHLNQQQQNDDLILFSRFLIEEVANKQKNILFPVVQMIEALICMKCISTTFNHELFIDKSKYQPIVDSISTLNEKIDGFKNGFIFLIGGPGSGKSTLLTEWSRSRAERIVKYYSFDFTNPSSGKIIQKGERVLTCSLTWCFN